MSFPDNCIKGILNNSFLVEDDGSIAAHLFHFKPEHARDDGWVEQSINWEDDESVIEFTLTQRKDDGELQFKTGIAIIPREEIDRLNRRPTVSGILSYERQTLEDNPYHRKYLTSLGRPQTY